MDSSWVAVLASSGEYVEMSIHNGELFVRQQGGEYYGPDPW